MQLDLVPVWTIILAVAVFMYVLLDGFDLGVGILFPFIRDEDSRSLMMGSVAPVWDGNETWLVLGGVGLLSAFPTAFAIIIPALYFPLLLMLLGWSGLPIATLKQISDALKPRPAGDDEKRKWIGSEQAGHPSLGDQFGITLYPMGSPGRGVLRGLHRRDFLSGRRARHVRSGLRRDGPDVRWDEPRLDRAVSARDRRWPAVRVRAARRHVARHEDGG